jgi:predicted  nucleic acid-binding Zn-ribbon protein
MFKKLVLFTSIMGGGLGAMNACTSPSPSPEEKTLPTDTETTKSDPEDEEKSKDKDTAQTKTDSSHQAQKSEDGTYGLPSVKPSNSDQTFDLKASYFNLAGDPRFAEKLYKNSVELERSRLVDLIPATENQISDLDSINEELTKELAKISTQQQDTKSELESIDPKVKVHQDYIAASKKEISDSQRSLRVQDRYRKNCVEQINKAYPSVYVVNVYLAAKSHDLQFVKGSACENLVINYPHETYELELAKIAKLTKDIERNTATIGELETRKAELNKDLEQAKNTVTEINKTFETKKTLRDQASFQHQFAVLRMSKIQQDQADLKVGRFNAIPELSSFDGLFQIETTSSCSAFVSVDATTRSVRIIDLCPGQVLNQKIYSLVSVQQYAATETYLEISPTGNTHSSTVLKMQYSVKSGEILLQSDKLKHLPLPKKPENLKAFCQDSAPSALTVPAVGSDSRALAALRYCIPGTLTVID